MLTHLLEVPYTGRMQQKDHVKLSNLIVYGGWTAASGVGLLAVGFFLGILLRSPAVMALMGLGVIAFVVGLGMIGFSVFSGLKTERADPTTGQISHWPDSLVQARFATNAIGETVFSDMDIDFEDPKTKLYVRITTGDGQRAELKARQEVWLQAGEGMRGNAVVQHDWLIGFAPKRGSGEGDPHR